VILYRPFRNSDPPSLARLWNRAIPESGAVRPLRVHELDVHAFGSVYFDREGLIVAESEGVAIGFVHAGFGPDPPIGQFPPLTVSTAMGTIAMMVVEPGAHASEVAEGLLYEAERYLRSRGARVIYAGGQWPLNPFYWGLYGGSECSGGVSAHPFFPAALVNSGYEAIMAVGSLQFPLDQPDPRDPRAILIRRQTELEVEEDALPVDWWQNQAIGDFHLAHFRLLDREGEVVLARATTFDMSWFGREDGRSRLGLVEIEVASSHRRKGYGRYLVTEVMKWARQHGFMLLDLQTLSTNIPALSFYGAVGFDVIDQSTVYRLPAPLLDRSSLSRP